MLEFNGEPVHGVDTAWLRMDRPTNLMVITAMVVVDALDFRIFRDLVRRRFLAFERFRRRPVARSGFYYWEPDEHFDLDAHVKRVALPGAAGREELQQYVSELISTPLDYSKPLWQFHFIENFGDRCAVVMRVHHCYADGLSLVAVFAALTDATQVVPLVPEGASKERPSPQQSESSRLPPADAPQDAYRQFMALALKSMEKYMRLSLKMSEESLHLLREPASLVSAGRVLLNALGELSRLAALPSDSGSGLKGTLGVAKACVWTQPLALNRFKAVSRTLGCSLNDLLLACVSGALRRYLSPQETVVAERVLHATVPVSIRSWEPAQDEPAEPDNRFGTVFMPLPIGIINPVERLYRIKHEMQQLRRSLQPGVSYGLMAALGLMPGRVQQQVTDAFSRKSSLVLSNVPGVQQPRYLGGRQIREAMFWVPQTGDIALGISLLSYNGQVQLGLVVDRQVIAEPERLLQAFQDELEAYEKLLATSPISAVARADLG